MVIAVRGKVQAVDTSGTSRVLSVKAPFFIKDTIKTEKRSRLQMMFKDNTIISLGPESELKISEYEWDADKKKGKMSSEIKEGAFRVMGGLISKESPEEFETKTPAGIIGIRGSMYAGAIREGELSVVFEGGRGITLKNGTGMITIMTPGYGSTSKGWNSAIARPKKFTTRDFMKLPTQMNRRNMLKKVLKSMKNPTPAEFNQAIKDVTRNDFSKEEAEQVVEELKKDPDFGCK